MISKRLKITMATGSLLLASALAVSVHGQGAATEQKAAAGVIQYRLVPVPNGAVTQEQLQSIMTTQGNTGWRFIAPFAVGSGPIPDKEVLLFSKP